jgi:hypothetical protein
MCEATTSIQINIEFTNIGPLTAANKQESQRARSVEAITTPSGVTSTWQLEGSLTPLLASPT